MLQMKSSGLVLVMNLRAEWRKLQEKHVEDVAKWVAVCKELAAKNVPKKNWPKKPVRPLKPKHAPCPREIPVASSSAVTLEDMAQDDETESEDSGEEFES